MESIGQIKQWLKNGNTFLATEEVQKLYAYISELESKKIDSMIPLSLVKILCEVWHEMNVIRARDGVPRCYDGRKSSMSQEYWDDLMQRIDAAVFEATGKRAWLHPCLNPK